MLVLQATDAWQTALIKYYLPHDRFCRQARRVAVRAHRALRATRKAVPQAGVQMSLEGFLTKRCQSAVWCTTCWQTLAWSVWGALAGRSPSIGSTRAATCPRKAHLPNRPG